MIIMNDSNQPNFSPPLQIPPDFIPPIEPLTPESPKPNRPNVQPILKLILGVLVIIAAIGSSYVLMNLKPATLPLPAVEQIETYNMQDRARYSEMVELINTLYDKYTRQDLTGEIWSRFDSDKEDYNYVIDFLSELNYYHKKLADYQAQQSSNPSELDYEIDYIIANLKNLETKFIAKAPLTTTITITLEDGTQVAVAKKTKTSLRYNAGTSQQDSEPDGIVAEIPLDKESWAQTFEGSLDGDGTYRTAAAQLAEQFDMYLDYNWANILDKCIGSSASEVEVIAAYCHATPDVVYVNKNATHYESNIRDIMFISTIKHEISHHLIALICGTARPPIAGALTEGITNSYANIFLGAHQKNEYYVNYPEYQMSDTTDAIARVIHDEKRCSQ
jgi:hypothetical protein